MVSGSGANPIALRHAGGPSDTRLHKRDIGAHRDENALYGPQIGGIVSLSANNVHDTGDDRLQWQRKAMPRFVGRALGSLTATGPMPPPMQWGYTALRNTLGIAGAF